MNLLSRIKSACFFMWERIGVLIFAGAILSPLLSSGYYGDDSLNMLIPSRMEETGRGLLSQYIYNFRLFAETRLSILQFFHGIFYVFRNLFAYKLVVLAFTLSNFLLLSYYVKLLTQSRTLSFFAVLIPPLLIQFRTYGDPVITFHAAAQINFLLLMTSLVTWIAFLKESKKSLLYSSIILYILCILSYEYSYPLFILHGILAYLLSGNRTIRSAARQSLPFFSVAVALAFLTLVVRIGFAGKSPLQNPDFVSAYVPKLALTPYLIMLAKEIFAAFPLTYALLDPHHLFRNTDHQLLLESLPAALAISLGGCFVFYRLLVSLKNLELPTKAKKVLFLTGIILLVFPNAILALSPKYQSDVVWGSAYTPVYISALGLSLILISMISSIFKTHHKLIAVIASLLASNIGAANYFHNRVVVQAANSFWHHPRTIAEQALKNGLFRDIPHNAFLFTNSDYPWGVTSFIRHYSGVRLAQGQYIGGLNHILSSPTDPRVFSVGGEGRSRMAVAPPGHHLLESGFIREFQGIYTFRFGQGEPVFYWDYLSDAENNGYALVGKIQDLQISETSFLGVTSQSADIYVRFPIAGGIQRSQTISFSCLDGSSLATSSIHVQQELFLKRILEGAGWKLFRISCPTLGQVVDMKSIKVGTISKAGFPSAFLSFKTPAEHQLLKSDSAYLHVGLNTPQTGTEAGFFPLKLGPQFTLEFIVVPLPASLQAPFAHLVGNHPGRGNFQGFVFQRDGEMEHFSFSIGDGNKWMSTAPVSLIANQTNYIAATVDYSGIEFFHQGKMVSSKKLDRQFSDSELPISIGNFINGDRPFNGHLRELKLTKGVMSSTDILKTWDKVNRYAH